MGSNSSKAIVTESIKAFVDSTIKSHKVVVFSGSYCPYCTKAKKALANYKINDIKIIELDKEYKSDFNSIMAYLGQMTGAQTVYFFQLISKIF
jgi:glutaredoxin 3